MLLFLLSLCLLMGCMHPRHMATPGVSGCSGAAQERGTFPWFKGGLLALQVQVQFCLGVF